MSLYDALTTEKTLYSDLKLPVDITFTEYVKKNITDKDGETKKEIVAEIKINRSRLIGLMIETLHPVCYNEVVYVFDSRTHSYVKDKKHIETFVSCVLNRLNVPSYDMGLFREANAAASLANTAMEFPFNLRNDAINCKNGVVLLTIDGPVLIPHDKDSHKFLFNYSIMTNYNKEWEHNTPDLYKILDEWGDRDFVVNSVAVGIHQSLMKDTWKTAFIVEGPKNAGKTTFLEFAQGTVGEFCYSQQGLIELSNDSFALSSVEGKLLNIADEAQKTTAATTELFKRITGSVRQPINVKYEPARIGIVTASYIFACNDLPEVKNVADSVFFGRWWISEFKNTFEVNTVKKSEILSTKMKEQYLVRIIERVQDISRNGFRNPYTSDQIEEFWKSRTVGADLWISECIMQADYKDNQISLAELHNHYTIWCRAQEQKFAPISDRALKSKLTGLGYGCVYPGNVCKFRGISFKFERREDKPTPAAGRDSSQDYKLVGTAL